MGKLDQALVSIAYGHSGVGACWQVGLEQSPGLEDCAELRVERKPMHRNRPWQRYGKRRGNLPDNSREKEVPMPIGPPSSGNCP